MFKIYPNNFFKGEGCPECGKKFRKKERALFQNCLKNFPNIEIIHSYYNAEILKKQELDIYMPKYKIGIEYQGEQHFYPIDFGGYGKEKSIEIFKENHQRDVKKKEICDKNGINLFYFSDYPQDDFLGRKVYHSYEELNEIINQVIKKENEK